ncbi:hypothetical protein THIOM_000894 [Candidatus Thiomargarita nelsonii]|uniref:Uncharacterized protein n=1 Tax=Candidatus Thiomargarita nelsonii TaxID=1003181 RepID=A0A176S5Z9_9GAMM|nr:hypothetical protein THIOM_000894 [Candidatus Thiomargarita nelsonii]
MTISNPLSVNCVEQVNQFEDCCLWLEVEDEIMLCEFVSGKSYWVFLGADEFRLMVCALEQYADSQGVNWQGQGSDYLAIGWCCLRLRHQMFLQKCVISQRNINLLVL